MDSGHWARAADTDDHIGLYDATEGLAPLLRQDILRTLKVVREQGQSVLIGDRDLEALAHVCDSFAVMKEGHIVHTGTATQLIADRRTVERLLGV